MFDPSSGLYTFGKRAPSTQVIPNEKYYESLRRCIAERDMYNENSEIKFIPDIPDDNCECAVCIFRLTKTSLFCSKLTNGLTKVPPLNKRYIVSENFQ